MDTNRFDQVVHQFAQPSTRRNAIRLGIISVLGITMAIVGADHALAGKRNKKKSVTERCNKRDQCGGGLTCKPANVQNSCIDSTEKRCREPVRASCNDGCECCGTGVICNGGYCDQARHLVGALHRSQPMSNWRS